MRKAQQLPSFLWKVGITGGGANIEKGIDKTVPKTEFEEKRVWEMSCYAEAYAAKRCTPEEIAQRIRPGAVCACGTCLSEPVAITGALGRRLSGGADGGIVHHQVMSVHPSPFFDEELRGKYTAVSWFSTAYGREAFYAGQADIMPACYRDIPRLYTEAVDLDVFYAAVSPMDSHGYFSFGTTGAECRALAEKARHIYLEVNPNMPRTFGDQHIHISRVELLCENDAPLQETPPVKQDAVSRAIGGLIAQEIPDGATIQLGIGAIPAAVGLCLKEKRNLGIHTELFSDSMVELIQCGAVTNTHKTIHRGKSITTLVYGTRKSYEFVADNVGVELYPVSYVNDPNVIARHDNFMSVNACLEVDMWGQVASESIGTRHFSGTGGQADFVRGARESRGGKSFLAMPATAKGGTVSRIRATLSPGAIVTTSKNEVDYIVTEFGIARLRGSTVRQRARSLIAIAAPQFREELTFEAKKLQLL